MMEFLALFTPLTGFFITLILVLTLYFHTFGYSSHTAGSAPTMLTSIGIFGTFLGVAIGLTNFNTEDIQQGVPTLIAGLQTAFWSSVAGLFSALTIKGRFMVYIIRERKKEDLYRAATIDDLANIMADIRDYLKNDRLQTIQELSRSREETNEHLSGLARSMDSYEERMTQANTKAFVDGINIVMRDFNTQINEQYGDNFKELNYSVGKMVEWQHAYKEQIDGLIARQQSASDIMQSAAVAYEEMVQHTQVFSTVSDSLGSMLKGLQMQSEALDSYLSGLAQLVSKASEGLPALEGRIETITDGLAQSVQQSNSRLAELVTHISQQISGTVDQVNNAMKDNLLNEQQALQQQVSGMVDRTEQQIARLDDAMEEELTKALQTFGYQLTALSEKFVNDYTPLTSKLKKLIEIANVDA